MSPTVPNAPESNELKNSSQSIRSSLILVGKVTKPHGLKGEVRCLPYIDPEKFTLGHVFQDDLPPHQLKIHSVRMNKGFVLLQFEGYNAVEEVEFLRGKELYLPRDALVSSKEEILVEDLIGVKVMVSEHKVVGYIEGYYEGGSDGLWRLIMTDEVCREFGKEEKDFFIPVDFEEIAHYDPEKNEIQFRQLDQYWF